MLLKRVIPLVVTLALLTAMTAQKLSYPRPKDAADYHLRVRQAVEAFPSEIGSWIGEDVPIPPAALKLLHPNAIVSRSYRNAESGRRVAFLVVQCREARDMAGHYPPVCYPANGWTPQTATKMKWTAAGKVLAGMEYEFAQVLPERSSTVTVDHLFVLPEGLAADDIKRVRKLASDYRRHFYGAGQIQVVFNDHIDATERQEITEVFLSASRTVIDAISSGVIHE